MTLKKKIAWLLVSLMMVLSLVVASCGTEDTGGTVTQEGKGQTITTGAEEEETEGKGEEEEVVTSSNEPQYGGTLNLCVTSEGSRPDLFGLGHYPYIQLAYNRIWDGDWSKGPAGGYGTNEVSWGEFSTNRMDLKIGHLAESWRFDVNSAAKEVTTVVTIRQGVHFARVDSEAGRLVNGRELNIDDVVWCENQFLKNPDSFNLFLFPYVKDFEAVKTGPWEFSITLPFYDHLGGIMRLFDNMCIYPPELQQKYGEGTGDSGFSQWKVLVGTGPFMVEDVIAQNMSLVVRNPDYWMTDPIGPGEGNQLPYVDRVKTFFIPDRSTMLAALRTANIEQCLSLTLEEKDQMLKQCPDIKYNVGGWGGTGSIGMLQDPPFDNVKVRRAMMMSIDYDTINRDLYAGLADLVTWPYNYQKAYVDLYLGLDDPDCPDSVKELYSYNPEKSKQLLTEAGYPDGFKFELTLTNTEVDYFSIIKDYFSKIGVDMSLNIIERGNLWNVLGNKAYQTISLRVSPPATYPEQFQFEGDNAINHSRINDPLANEAAVKSRELAITDFRGAMKITREITKHLLEQAYVIPAPYYPVYVIWWPWIKNYSGEQTVGYMNGAFWAQHVWLDQDMKKSLGH
jgi:peptide/nickel transport system substrate-binding protein